MKIFGVQFKDNGKCYFFKTNDNSIKVKDNVIVQTEKGEQFGIIAFEVEEGRIKDISMIKDITRLCTDEDIEKSNKNKQDAIKAMNNAKKFVNELGLDMKVIDASFTFDRSQLLINFSADERVDFRELAKKLAALYKTRIELRQIGVRDKAKEIGGIGICGMEVCCKRYMNHIGSVSMNTAKNQNIALNPNKINGVCGRLLCCLAYEDEEYSMCQRGLPSVGQSVKTEYGTGIVKSVNILERKYKVDVDGNIKEIELGPCHATK